MKQEIFKFQEYDNIGVAGAEEDGEFLSECFIDTGILDIVKDISDHRQIIIGRTG